MGSRSNKEIWSPSRWSLVPIIRTPIIAGPVIDLVSWVSGGQIA